MAIGDYGEGVISSEQIVLSIRAKLSEGEALTPDDPKAKELNCEIRGLVEVLLERHEKVLAAYARQLTAAVPSLFDDLLSEIVLELIKAIRSPSRKSLAKSFKPRLKRIALDAYDRFKSNFQGTPGLVFHVEEDGAKRAVRFESADAAKHGDDGEDLGSLAEKSMDGSAGDAFHDVIGSEAYRQVAPKLTDRQRAIVEMKLQGYSDVRIAKELGGIHRDTVKADLDRAIAILERHLTPQTVENS